LKQVLQCFVNVFLGRDSTVHCCMVLAFCRND